MMDARSSVGRNFSRCLAAMACMALLSGCVAIGVEALKIIYVDPRSKIHVYDMLVEISFHLGDAQVRSVQYGDVYYFDGEGAYSFPTCDKSKAPCWAITPEYFIALKNGDIASVHVEKTALALSQMRPSETVRVKGAMWSIYRSQPVANSKKVRCDSLDGADLFRFYGLPMRRHPGEVGGTYAVDVEITATRVEETERRHRTFDPVDFYGAWSTHDCEQMAKRIPIEHVSP